MKLAGLAGEVVEIYLCSSCCRISFHDTNIEIGEDQQDQEPEDAYGGSGTDTFVEEAGAVDIDNDVVGGVTGAAIRHGPDDGELVETPDELQGGGYNDDAAQLRYGHVPEAAPGSRAIHSSGVDQFLRNGL